jgi:hypothetical protein
MAMLMPDSLRWTPLSSYVSGVRSPTFIGLAPISPHLFVKVSGPSLGVSARTEKVGSPLPPRT